MSRARRNEQGSILVLALLVSMVLLAFGLTIMWYASSGARASGNINRRQEAIYAAEAGIERAQLVLASSLDWNTLLKGCPTCAAFDNKRGNILCAPPANTCMQDVQVVDSATKSFAAHADPAVANYQYTIWVRNDWAEECDAAESDITQVDCDGNGSRGTPADIAAAMKDNNGRIVVLVEGKARDGLSSVRLEIVLTGSVNKRQYMGGYEGQKRMGGQGTSSLVGHSM